MRVLLVIRGAATREDRVTHCRLIDVLEHVRGGGVEVTVALADDPGGLRHQLGTVAPVHVLPGDLPPDLRSVAALPRVADALRRLTRVLRPDVIEGDEPIPALAAGLASRGTGAVVIYRRHHQTGSPQLRLTSRLAATLADYTAVSNEAVVAEACGDDHVKPARILIVTSGTPDLRPVPVAERLALLRRLRIPDGAGVVTVVARLRREKGIDVLLAAATDLYKRPSVILIVGSGAEERALRAAAAPAGASVTFAGHQDDVAPWLAISDVIAIPSRRETFGRITLEAMAACKPIVATRVGGLRCAVDHGANGLLVEPENALELADALGTVLDHPGLAAAMAREGRRRYETRYTTRHMATSWAGSWEQAMAGVSRSATDASPSATGHARSASL